MILGGLWFWWLRAAPRAALNPGWRVYENKTYGISFEYPSSLAVTEGSSHGYFSVSVVDPKTYAGYLSIQVPDNRAQKDTYERILASLRITDAPNTTDTASQDVAILACYPHTPTGAADKPIPNDSVQRVKETSRLFINMLKDLYPRDLKDAWTTVSGNAVAGAVGGGFGEVEGTAPDCWSSYVDFEGSGEVDLRVKSVAEGTPDYFVRFIVSQLSQ